MARTETVTVVFTDVVGSTELASRLGHDAYEALRREHFAAWRAVVGTHNGTEVKTTGDGLMLCFPSAADAVGCAVALQQATGPLRRRSCSACASGWEPNRRNRRCRDRASTATLLPEQQRIPGPQPLRGHPCRGGKSGRQRVRRVDRG